jgi:outer membrane protein assembly factor BamB
MMRIGSPAISFISCLLAASLAQAQFAAQAPADLSSQSAPIGGVYVNDSAVVMDKMALAARLQDQKDWNKSAEVYQEITDKYRDRVAPSPTQDDPSVLSQYVSVLGRVDEQLCAWPEEGLAVYRARYELAAQKLLNSATADDLGPLHEAFTRYFVTESGKQAGLKLIDDYFELGQFSAAGWIGRELLAHPTLGDAKPLVLFQVALAAHLGGDDDAAAQTLQELKDHFPQARSTIGGRDVNLADELALQIARPVRAGSASGDSDSWPMLGGDESRGKISRSTARPGARLYSISLPARSWNSANPAQRKQLEDNDKQIRAQGAMLGVMPVADRGELFFQTNDRVYARNMADGSPLPGWLATYPTHKGEYVIPNATPLPPWHQLSVTLTDSTVLAVMNLPEPLAQIPGREARLVCLDRKTGGELWKMSTADLPDANLRLLSLGGSPLVVGSNVYIAAHGGKGNGYEDGYVLCLDAATGNYRWSCYLASAPSGGVPLMNLNNFAITSLSDVSTHLSYSSGRVFACTNLGAIAALDAYNGNVVWLDIYRDPDDAVGSGFPMPGMRGGFWGAPVPPQEPIGPPPWTPNAPIVRDGRLFVLPSDGKYLLVCDAGTGHVLKKLPKDEICVTSIDETNEKPDTLLGVIENEKGQELILLGTASRVFAIDWRKFNPDHQDWSVAWASMAEPKDPIRGRAFVTADSVYIPNALTLYRLQLRNGLIAESYPADSSWPDDEGPGNVLVCSDKIVVAGDTRVTVYTDLKLAKAKLDEEVAAAPNDPGVRLDYAETMFLADQPDLALTQLDAATDLLKRTNNRAQRSRAFSDAMTFAVHRAPDVAAALFDRADSLAISPAEKAAFFMARADMLRLGPQPNYAKAILLYQRILGDSSLRSAPAPDLRTTHQPVTEVDDQTNLAGAAATAAIAAMIRDRGPAVYKPIDHEARVQFLAAKVAHDPARLLEVSVTYPNSPAAGEAASLAAQDFEEDGLHSQAVRVLRDTYFRGLAPAGQTLQALARNYLKISGRMDAARACLAAARFSGADEPLLKPLHWPDGSALAATTLDAATAEIEAAIRKSVLNQSDRLPDFGIPSHDQAHAFEAAHHAWPAPLVEHGDAIANVDSLLVPAAPFARADRVVTWTNGSGLSIREPGIANPLGTDADFSTRPRGLAWVNNDSDLLVWSASGIALVDGPHAGTRWSVQIDSLPELTVLASAAPDLGAQGNLAITQIDPQLQRRLMRQRPIAIPRNRQIFMRGFVPGAGGPITPPDAGGDEDSEKKSSVMVEETIAAVIPLADRAIVSTSTGRVMAMSLSDGSILWQTRATEHALDRLLATDDFTVFKIADDSGAQIVLLDTSSGRMLGRREFGPDPSTSPINIALGDDGTLAYSQSDRIRIFNLYESAGDQKLLSPEHTTQPLPDMFVSMGEPNQLLIHGGQIIALSDNGGFVRIYDAQTGQFRPTSQPLSTFDRNPQMGFTISNGFVYAIGPQSAIAYNLENPDVHWDSVRIRPTETRREPLIGSDYLVLLNASNDPESATADLGVLSAINKGGALVFDWVVPDRHGIVACQAVSGGICYLSGDRSLHLLVGNRKLTEP